MNIRNTLFAIFILVNFTIFAQNRQSLPLNEDFNSSSNLPTGWTLETDTYNWEIEAWGVDATNAITYAWDGSQAKTGWFFTPSLELTAGQVYFIEFMMRAPGMNGSVESLRLKAGSSPTSADMTELIWEDASVADGVFKKYIFPFTANTTSSYNFGWQSFTPAAQDFIAIDNISIYEAPDVDISIQNSMLPDAELLGNSPNSKLYVQNLSNEAKSFNVKLSISENGNQVHTETINVSNLDVTNTQEVVFTDFIPSYEATYTYTYDIIVSGSDANISDNQLVKTVPIIDGCEHKIVLSTKFNPWGWLGASVTIKSNDILVLSGKTLENGNITEFTFPSSENANLVIDFDNEGEYQTNCSWEVFDGENNSLISGTGTTSGVHIIQNATGNCPAVEIKNVFSENITISPNPTSENINIQANGNYKLTIFDISGRVIQETSFSENKTLSFSQKGIFFLKFENKYDVFVKKIIVE